MSIDRTFNPLQAQQNPGTGGSYELRSGWGFESAERTRQAIDALGYVASRFDLGGEQYRGISAAAFTPIASYKWYDLDARAMVGFTKEVCYTAYTSNGAVPVKIRLYNVTDGASCGDSGDVASTTASEGSFSVVLPTTGMKRYRAELIGGASDDVFVWGVYLRIYKVPA
jgi:hypothetical protein